ncbi:MAG: hypothetical protein CMC04_11355 [Flavobacteriaceae bacterium]|nr:hypothetical protein [Flavobacteriaceae bacterium]MAH81646.1 hypothetical protein [Flavobacteriaceae bacterium]
MIDIEIIGFIAAILTTSAYLPQAFKIWRTKNAESVSLSMYSVMFLGIFLWLVYSIYLKRPSMIFANVITIIIISTIIFLKIKSKKNS